MRELQLQRRRNPRPRSQLPRKLSRPRSKLILIMINLLIGGSLVSTFNLKKTVKKHQQHSFVKTTRCSQNNNNKPNANQTWTPIPSVISFGVPRLSSLFVIVGHQFANNPEQMNNRCFFITRTFGFLLLI